MADEYETQIFSKVVYAAERVGKPVSLVAVPGNDPCGLILQAVRKLRSSRVVISQSMWTPLEEQEQKVSQGWEQLQERCPLVSVELVPHDDHGETLQIHLESSP